MKQAIKAIKNIFSIADLRTRILNTLLFLLLFRIGSFIVLPGIDPTKLVSQSKGILGLLDAFLGGAFSNASIFGLGIMPYITASIIVQLLTIAVPYFQKMQKEGESGRQKLNRITRGLTVLVTIPQSYTYLISTISDDAILPNVGKVGFLLTAIIVLTTGTIFCMWIGERITEKGIGNGTSMLIMIGIISRLPVALFGEAQRLGIGGILFFVVELIVLFFIVMGVVVVLQATRRIPIQYAKQVVGGNRVYGGQRQYLPLKLNAAGVMPIIFAQSLMFLPSLLSNYFVDKNDAVSAVVQDFADYTSLSYNLLFALLIILFSFFYTAITVNPVQIAEEMKRNGGFVPGVKPGIQTSDYIDSILSRITLPGALFLSLLAILPAIASLFGITSELSRFFGGTSLLIMVGVILDTLQQIESYLLMQHYEGLMKSGRVQGRSETIATV